MTRDQFNMFKITLVPFIAFYWYKAFSKLSRGGSLKITSWNILDCIFQDPSRPNFYTCLGLRYWLFCRDNHSVDPAGPTPKLVRKVLTPSTRHSCWIGCICWLVDYYDVIPSFQQVSFCLIYKFMNVWWVEILVSCRLLRMNFFFCYEKE
jgi:hypothetical protein